MTTVSDLLKAKDSQVFTVGPHISVFRAIARMDAHGIGCLVVYERAEVVGIITERDYLKKVVLKGRTSRGTLVGAIMSSPVITVRPADLSASCLALMGTRRIRHLPVVDQGRLIGLISMGDCIRQLVEEQRLDIGSLVSYIQTSSAANLPALH